MDSQQDMAEGFILCAAEILVIPPVFFRHVRDSYLMQAGFFFFTLLCLHSILAGVLIRGIGGSLFCSVPFIDTTSAGEHTIIAAIAGSFLFGIFFIAISGAGIHLTAVVLGTAACRRHFVPSSMVRYQPSLLDGLLSLASSPISGPLLLPQ